MEGIDLSSLSKSVVEEAVSVAPSQPTNEQVTPEVTVTESKVETPETPEAVIEEDKEAEELKKQEALDKLDKVIEDTDITKVVDPTETPKKEEETTTEDSTFATLGSFMKEKGILENIEDIKDEDSFVEAINKTIESNKYANLTDSQLTYLKALEAGIPEEQAKVSVQNISVLENLDNKTIEESEGIATDLVVADLTAQGWTKARIERQVALLKKTEALAEEAKLSKESLIEQKKNDIENAHVAQKKAEEKRAKEDAAQVKAIKEAVYGETKALGTIKADDKLKNQVYAAMTKVVDTAENGTPLNALMKDRVADPVDFEKRMYFAYVLTDGFKNLDKLQRRAESTAARKLKDVVANLNIGTNSGGAPVHTQETTVPNIVKV